MQLILPIYNVDIDGVVRTFLMVVPSQQNRSRASFHESNRFMHLSLRLMRPTKGDIASGLPASFTYIRNFLCPAHEFNMSGSKHSDASSEKALKDGNRK